MSKQIRKWIKNKKKEIKSQNLLENTNMVNANNNVDEDAELEVLNNQMKFLLTKIKNIISRTSNKNKGYAILHDMGKAIQDAMGVTDVNLKKAVLGQMPSQNQR